MRTFLRCAERYNTVVFRSERSDGWTVYLLAASDIAGKVMIGGHHRFEISSDGQTVKSQHALSQSCLTFEGPVRANTVARVVTHNVSPTPEATHVFINLLHGLPLGVATRDGIWIINEGKILFHGEP